MKSSEPLFAQHRLLRHIRSKAVLCPALLVCMAASSAPSTEASEDKTAAPSARFMPPGQGKAPTPRYLLTDLGRYVPGASNLGPGLSPDGQVAGWMAASNAACQAALLTKEKPVPLESLAGYAASYAAGINAAGRVVGVAANPQNERESRAVVWEQRKPRALNVPDGGYSVAHAVNEAGVIAGGAAIASGDMQAVVWQENLRRSLGRLAKGNFSLANAINAQGHVAGYANVTPNGTPHAFLWRDGRMRDLGLLPGGHQSHARALNDRDEVVGWADQANGELRSFLWRNGKMEDLGSLGDDPAAAWGINNRGQVVGNSGVGKRQVHAFLWEKGHLTDLNETIAPGSGWTLRFAYRINDAGQILGLGFYQKQSHLFLLTPITAAAGAPSVSPAPAKTPTATTPSEAGGPVPVGSPAPPLRLTDLQGKARTLAEWHGHPIALCFFCGCDACHRVAREWAQVERSGVLSASKPKDAAPQTVIVFLGDAAGAKAFAAATGLDPTQAVFLLDPVSASAVTFGALPCPRLFALDPKGVVRYVNAQADDAPPQAPAALLVSRLLAGLTVHP